MLGYLTSLAAVTGCAVVFGTGFVVWQKTDEVLRWWRSGS